ncbi:methyltransferase domain-containing protein [Planctomycetota bacterium]|nr:methyltransferase domain-containing protein [Planctomycetota bacterium]
MKRKDDYLEPYREATGKHGSDFKVTLWANEKTQQLRFRVFCEMCYMGGKRVLDAGCSRGDFATYLNERKIEYAKFVGVDGLDEVIEFAKGRGIREAEFYAGDFVADGGLLGKGDPQIVTISGTLNTMSDEEAIRVLESAWAGASETLLFNFLSDKVSSKAQKQGWPARRLPTVKLLEWALSKTPLVAYRQDYFENGHDATIMMIKE